MKDLAVYTTNLKNYKPLISGEGHFVFKNYGMLKNYLKQKLGPEYATLFSEPYISADALKGKEDASWRSEAITENSVEITSLSPERRQAAGSILKSRLRVLNGFAEKLIASENPDEKKWGDLIIKACIIPGESHIMVDQDNIVLVAWGFEQLSDENKNYSFKKEFYAQPKKETSPSEDAVEVNEHFGSQTPSLFTPGSMPSSSQETITPRIVEKAPDTNVGGFIKDPPPPKRPGITGKQKPGWKRYWWILLLLIILFLIFFLLRGCEPRTRYLPAQPGRIVPIDTTKIITDPDSVRSIVSDRLNIAITGGKQDINAFAEQFKKLYPGDEYQVIYYDTMTYRLQVQIPAAEREKIKAILPGQMKDFQLLIWYEGIFQKNNRPTDPGFANAMESWYLREIKAYEAWDITKGDSALIVAIIDDGFDMSHPEFKNKIDQPWNVPGHSNNVSSDGQFIHGTHVGGIALALSDNGRGVAGIAPKCRFMPVQVADKNGVMSSTSIIDGVLYAIHHGAKVINMSLGMTMAPGVEQLPASEQEEMIKTLYKDEEQFWAQLFKTAYDKNVVVVLAAGNQDILIGLDAMQRSPYTIKVSAIGPDEKKAEFSNYGNPSTISAPGVRIYSSIPNNNFQYLDGTSMASPIVAGGVALMKSVNPSLGFDDVVSILQSTGKPVNSPGKYVGNIIQLAEAVSVAAKNSKQTPKVSCPDVQKRIDSLMEEVRKLQKQCADSTSGDTLKIPKNSKNLDFASGRWKSTTKLVSISDKKLVTIYFDFNNSGKGEVEFVEEDNTICNAALTLSLNPGEFLIRQQSAAGCGSSSKSYSPYSFVCTADANGYAECFAQNLETRSNKFQFKLVKIK